MLGVVRLRRYRSLLLLVVIAIIVFTHFYSFGDSASSFSVDKLKEYTSTVSKNNLQDVQWPVAEIENPIPPPEIAPIAKPTPRPSEPEEKPPTADKGSSPKIVDTVVTPSSKSASAIKTPAPKLGDVPTKEQSTANAAPAVPSQVHWKESPEHYPLPEELIIPLPKIYKKLPQIQASFEQESETKRKVRIERQDAIRDAMKHAWKGYKEHAWGHDEIMPVSASYKDPFGGWGATLVDSLDTLWIMGLEHEFLEAVKATGKIDFTTTPMTKIPVFETVIRYLGGLIGAYDVSGGKHQVLLDKAIELADMLYGVFDTPNRMPVLYFGWKPAQVAKQNRADIRVVSAELGSLTVEFTRLAQITGDNRFYDAVQRITDALEEFQPKTSLPGMWPLTMDASGCQVVKVPVEEQRKTAPASVPPPANGMFAEDTGAKKVVSPPVHNPGKRQLPQVQETDWLGEMQGGRILTESEKDARDKAAAKALAEAGPPPGLTLEAQSGKIRHEGDIEPGRSKDIGAQLSATSTVVAAVKTSPSCLPQGLKNAGYQREQKFTLGGMSDSLYEYLIKEYILLGGASDQYKRMYESSMDIAKKYLFFRPLAEGDPDILLSGNVYVNSATDVSFDTNTGHLTCFTGGMLALGARALGLEADLEIGSKLTDGCVWAYFSMESGIMPEGFQTAYCQNPESCKFNPTQYYEQLVPKYKKPKKVDEAKKDKREGPTPAEKQRLQAIDPNAVPKEYPVTLEGVAKQMIEEESLPSGFTKISDRRYILRPEAIESVFIMYRLTADTTWQDKGWRMWQALERATKTEFAFSAISDVTKSPSHPMFSQVDSMESFFPAETLKYYYLLFSEPDLVSLDDYVLNTEAHPLRRPRPSS